MKKKAFKRPLSRTQLFKLALVGGQVWLDGTAYTVGPVARERLRHAALSRHNCMLAFSPTLSRSWSARLGHHLALHLYRTDDLEAFNTAPKDMVYLGSLNFYKMSLPTDPLLGDLFANSSSHGEVVNHIIGSHTASGVRQRTHDLVSQAAKRVMDEARGRAFDANGTRPMLNQQPTPGTYYLLFNNKLLCNVEYESLSAALRRVKHEVDQTTTAEEPYQVGYCPAVVKVDRQVRFDVEYAS